MGGQCSTTDDRDLTPRQAQRPPEPPASAPTKRVHAFPPRLYAFILGTADQGSPVYRLREVTGVLDCIAVHIRRDSARLNPWWGLPRAQWPAQAVSWYNRRDARVPTSPSRLPYGTIGPPFEWTLRIRLNPDPPASMDLQENGFWDWSPDRGYLREVRLSFSELSTAPILVVMKSVHREWGVPPCMQLLSSEPGPFPVAWSPEGPTYEPIWDSAEPVPCPSRRPSEPWKPPHGARIRLRQGDKYTEKGLDEPLLYLSVQRAGCNNSLCEACN